MKTKHKPQMIIVTSLFFSIIILCAFIVYVSYSQPKSLKEIYVKSLVEVLENGNNTLERSKYIAIDLDTLKGLHNEEKKAVITYFVERYKMPVIDSSYSDLIENGIEKKSEELEGTILYLEKIENHFVFINVYVAKEYGSLGANGLLIKFRFRNGEWIIWKTRQTWIS